MYNYKYTNEILFLTDSKLYLLATWPQLTDQMVVDSQSYSDLEPMQAPFWAVKIELAGNTEAPRLSHCLSSLCKLSRESLDPCKYDSFWFINMNVSLTEHHTMILLTNMQFP